MIDGGFPIYILDDESIFFLKEDISHCEFWEKFIAKIVAKKYSISKSDIINLPYCQRRARIVGNKFYCGEKISKKLFKKIQKEIGFELFYCYDDHETRCQISVSELKSHIN